VKDSSPAFRVAIYARVSTPGQAERDLSIPEQIEAVQRFCEARDWPVVAVFKDAGISGSLQVRRTEFQRMLREGLSKNSRFNLVLTRDAARFGRGDQDNPNRANLRQNGVRVDNIESPVGDMKREGMTPGESFNERIKSAVDILQREEIPARVIASQKRIAREGGLPGAQGTMFGYRSVWKSEGAGKPKRTVEPEPTNAAIVKQMFERYIDTGSIKNVTRWLNSLGVASPGDGIEWYDTTVRSILTNETVLGRIVYGRIRKVKNARTEGKSNVKNTADIIRFDGAFTPLVTQDLFDKVQRKLSLNERKVPGAGNPGNTLRGIGRCGCCGWHLAHQKNSSTGAWYYMCGRVKMHKAANSDPKCKGILLASYVDEVVLHFVERTVLTSGYSETLKAAIATYNAAAAEYKGIGIIETLDSKIASLSTRCKNFADAIGVRGALPSLIDALTEAEAALDVARRNRANAATILHVESLNEAVILTAATSLRTACKSGDVATAKHLLPEIVDHIRVDFTLRENRYNHGFSYSEAFKRSNEVLSKSQEAKLRAAFAAFAARAGKQGTFVNVDPVVQVYNGEHIIRRKLTSSERKEVEESALFATFQRHRALEPWERLPGSKTFSAELVTLAPLEFVAKWDLSNLERISEDALRRIGSAMSPADSV